MALESKTVHQAAPPQPPTNLSGEDPLGQIGRKVGGKYEIAAHIGSGGFGEVYEAHNVNLPDQRLVIKFFKQVRAKEKFDKEARILCKLDHPNISRVVDYIPDESALVIHRIDGKDAEALLWEEGPLSADLFLAVARTMAEAVAYAHEQGIAHRDIKPSNILIDKNRHVYLIDFGIAKEIGGTATKTGRVALTPNFAAPERHAGILSYNPFLTDIYELGVTLFNLATKSLPYHNPASPAVEEWRSNASRKLARPLRRILKKAMHPDPKRRYASADELSAAFARLQSVYEKPWRRPVILAGSTIAAAVIGYASWAAFSGPAAESPGETSHAGSGRTADTPQSPPPEPAIEPATPSASALPSENATEGQPTAQNNPPASKPVRPEPERPVTKPPVTSRQVVRVTPADNRARLLVAGSLQTPGEPFYLKPGKYRVRVSHPDYPLLEEPLIVQAGVAGNIAVDLQRAFARTDTARLQLAIVPPSDSHLLKLTLNEREHHFSRFPVLDFRVLSGEWQARVEVQPLNVVSGGEPRVDSCRYYYGQDRRPGTLKGDRGRFRLGKGKGRLQVFWSQ